MTKRTLSFQMMRKNYKRYLLCYFGNFITIAVCQTFAAIYTNPDFMNEALVDPLISSNIIAPSVFTFGLMLLFIPYSYRTFFHKRKNEYAVLLALGGTEKDVFLNMIFENLTISLFSLVTGLALGTVISLTFFEIIRHFLNIYTVYWQFTPLSYGISTAVYLSVVTVTLVLALLDFAKTQIVALLKIKSRGEKAIRGGQMQLLFSSLLLLAAAILLLRYFKPQSSWALPLSFGLTLVGLWFFLNSVAIIWRKHTHGADPRAAFVLKHFRSYRTVAFLAGVLFGIGIFLMGISAVTYPNFIDNAEKSSPYDLLYIETGGNNAMSLNSATKILNENGVTVSEATEIPYQRNGVFNLFSASTLNRLTGSDYNVLKGDYLVLYQYNLNDGYRHDMGLKGSLHFELDSGETMLNYGGKDIRILFNQNPGFADRTLILNDADYNAIENTSKDYYSGIVRCFCFQNVQNASLGLSALRQVLSAQNRYADSAEKDYFAVSSKYDTEKTAGQSAAFLILTMGFVTVLFVIAANIIIYYQILNEYEDFKTMMRSLFRIGLTEKETHALIRGKNRFYCLFPFACGSLCAIFFTAAFAHCNGSGWEGALFTAAISLFLFLIESIVHPVFTHLEEKTLQK